MHTITSHTGLIATISEKGAELISLIDKNQKEFIWEGNPEFWGKHSPVLFPIVGTLKNNSYEYDGKQYSLSRHGFARDMLFIVIEKSEKSITFSLSDNEHTFNIYPFRFELLISYTLEENSLQINYKVQNKNTFKMPFSIGAHPAFALSENFEKYSLLFPNDEKLYHHPLENDLLSDHVKAISLKNHKLSLSYELFKDDALVFKTIVSKNITILKNGLPQLKLHFNGFPNLGIWTKTKAPFLCIEPWFGYSDSANASGNITEKEGIQIIEPDEKFESAIFIEVF